MPTYDRLVFHIYSSELRNTHLNIRNMGSKKDKKDKKSKKDSDEGTVTETVKATFVSPIAKPLADDKLSKKVT